MDKKELFEKGVNDSLVHVDFMMGTEDLMIDGILEDGSHVKIFENGNFVDLSFPYEDARHRGDFCKQLSINLMMLWQKENGKKVKVKKSK